MKRSRERERKRERREAEKERKCRKIGEREKLGRERER